MNSIVGGTRNCGRSRCSQAVSVVAAATALLTPLTTASSARAQASSVLYSFQCVTTSDGANPYGELIVDSAGNLYGTTQAGGDFNYGTVFEISPGGTETVLYSFAGPPDDGSLPRAGVVRDAAGNLYGTTRTGGVHDEGTVFEVSAQGAETVLHSFFANKRDGAYPFGALLLDSAGNLYGTTSGGGTSFEGTIFRVSPAATESVLYSFGSSPGDGFSPEGSLVRDSAGNLYGTTGVGGAAGEGTVFEMSKGPVEVLLHTFTGPPDGGIPLAGAVRDPAGNLYGTTSEGGHPTQCPGQPFQGCGAVFKVTPTGQETLLYSFLGGADGGVPYSDLVMDPKGNLYGTSSQGGSSSNCDQGAEFVGCGVVFEITSAGRERVLHSFNSGSDGRVPYAGLLYSKGALYGTTTLGGTTFDCGTVFKITP